GAEAGHLHAERRAQGRLHGGRPEPARPAASRRRRPLAEIRLRPGHLRGLHHPAGRRAAACLPPPRGGGGGAADRYGHRPRRARAASPPGRLHGTLRGAVRLLHTWDADGGQGAAGPQSRPDARGGDRGDRRKSLPLHRLRADHRRHPRCRGRKEAGM
ncbi:MAG: 4-hydroxybenzoyl-CoA reductase, gamma subunit, partial [uncultured Craurococcus sp.]